MDHAVHANTPFISAVDGRELSVREIVWRRTQSEDEPISLTTTLAYNAAGQLIAQRDPRVAGPNLSTIYSLSTQPLLTDSVDAGWRLTLLGEAGQGVERWDGRGGRRQTEYDALLRPVAINEGFIDPIVVPVRARLARESVSPTAHTIERFNYSGPDAFEHNQCNQLTRHDDPAGTLHWPDYGLLGSPLSDIRHFLLEPETPDWPLLEAERDELLEADGLETQWTFNALGEVIEQTDAMGNAQQFAQTVAGQLKSVSLALAGSQQVETLVSDIRYNAFDQVEQETAGNGVISRSTYDSQSGRLSELRAALSDSAPLQDLKYDYDPVGNILSIEDSAQPVRFFANQRIASINRYCYDTLYQLIEATGREVKTGSSHDPALPHRQNLPPDPNQIANYTQSYDYDAGGNLLQMRHVGAQTFTRTMLVAPDSNRSLPEDEVDVDFEAGFDANGNLQQLVRGQDLRWDVRNQLCEVTAVKRDDGTDDIERYVYDGGGQRCRKIRSAQSRNRTLIDEVRYLPGLEIRSSAEGEILHVITVQAGRNSVRVLHWQTQPPAEIANNQLRYSLTDHLGSSTLELDHQGGLLSQESYYPFGGTAWWAARNATEAKYKTVRYSGKERDASGLYYYGFRYYAPWLQRWINPDPAGDVDGLNRFMFVHNRPTSLYDDQGAITTHLDHKDRAYYKDEGLASRLEAFKRQHAEEFKLIKSKYTHDVWKPYTITLEYKHPDFKQPDYFDNKFTPSKWTFKQNFKNIREEPVVHADHIAVAQFLEVSANKFEGILPSVIKRSMITNKGVKDIAKTYKDSPDDLMKKFFADTQNGKSTQRLLNTFQLRAIRVEAVFSGSDDLDIYIQVEPKALTITGTTTVTDKTPAVTSTGSRFSVTPVLPPKPTSRFDVTPVNPPPSQSRFSVTPVTLAPTSPTLDRRRAH
jgi:insecticidal toxin complex protein TccC